MFDSFPFVPQHDAMDCGPACLAMVAQKYGKKHSLQFLRDNAYLTREGVSLTGLNEAALIIGFDALSIRSSLENLINEEPLPCILFWNNCHFVVLYKIKKRFFSKKCFFKIADPSAGLITVPESNFKESWLNDGKTGVAFLLEPSDNFNNLKTSQEPGYNVKHLLKYIYPYKKDFLQLILSLAVGSLFTLILPFLTQSLIDKGIVAKNLNFVFTILLAQVLIFLGTVNIEIVRNWLVLYIGARINISIISDYFKKIMKLPIRFFDTKFMGDFYQRIHDHSRIEQFLTSQSLTTFFSIVNFLIFFFVLFHYNNKILLVYASLTLIAIVWSRYFLKKRAYLDYFNFRSNALNNQSINEMINGIQEIKLNSFENFKRKQWEEIQVKLFNVKLNVLKLDQVQLIGYDFINQLKNIIVTFIAAREVVLNNITLGEMLAVVYIIGQMNSPINQLITFFRSLQDAQLSMKRLTEVQNEKEEDLENQIILSKKELSYNNGIEKGIRFSNVSFQYEGPQSPFVLKNINLFIPEGKITAIVGGSGSGKTTLMKLLLRFYEPNSGEIKVDHYRLSDISPSSWRQNCGVVMENGYIFSETIYRNIATKDAIIDENKLKNAIRIANIGDYINSLPLNGNTKIGSAGSGISGGQWQRILIARAIYKQPHFIFFDEATSALDTENEKIIHDNLRDFFCNKTVIIIAHRLSTVKNADQTIVLNAGEIVEKGTHAELVKKKGYYYNLVKNQLELEDS